MSEAEQAPAQNTTPSSHNKQSDHSGLQTVQKQQQLEQLRQQNHTAFAELVDEYNQQLLIVARAIVSPAIADEVVQEAWVSIYRALPKFQGRSSLKTWMFTIVSNEAKTRLRKESRMVSLDEREEENPNYLADDAFQNDGHWKHSHNRWSHDTPEALMEEKQLQCCIEKTLELLPDKQRAVFLLRDIEQQALSEICNILELSDSNVRVLVHRARVKLLQVIDHYEETGEC
jgi:RNA polymerase sigma-70 factor (ECF subfamily)